MKRLLIYNDGTMYIAVNNVEIGLVGSEKVQEIDVTDCTDADITELKRQIDGSA